MEYLFAQMKVLSQELDLYRQVILFYQYCLLTKCFIKNV